MANGRQRRHSWPSQPSQASLQPAPSYAESRASSPSRDGPASLSTRRFRYARPASACTPRPYAGAFDEPGREARLKYILRPLLACENDSRRVL